MMTVEEFQQEKTRLVALYGSTTKDAMQKRAQAFAELYAKSQWTERALAEKEHFTQTRINQLVRFGRFLLFLKTRGFQTYDSNEKHFRALWQRTDATSTEDVRFIAIAQLVEDGGKAETPQRHDRQAVRRLSKQLIEQFADGKWHALRDMTEAVEADSILIRGIMDRMVKEGTFQTFAERKSSGKGWYSYRMVKGGKKKIDLQVFQTEIAPALQEMERLVNEHHIHFSQGAMKMAVTKFRKVIDTLTR
jgi:hypothetical protein